jgi:TolB-like protein
MVGPAGTIGGCAGVITSAADNIEIRLFGRGAHGSMPQASIDPVIMAAATVMRLQTIVSRELAAAEAAVVTIGSLQAGTKENVIPDEAVITLLARHGDLVSKEEVMDAVWPGTAVAENNLTVQISALRRVLDHGRAGGSCIQTIAGRGYRFVGAVDRAPPAATPSLPDKPSIAVLPFTNMSGDPEQEYFADGMVEEIITALSRIRWLFVIARNSSFTYKGQTTDVKQVGRELGVRYVLEGSVRKAGGRVRIAAQPAALLRARSSREPHQQLLLIGRLRCVPEGVLGHEARGDYVCGVAMAAGPTGLHEISRHREAGDHPAG